MHIISCSSLRNLSPLSHPQANVQILSLQLLDIVDLDVQGRIPQVTLSNCRSIINVAGLALCRKISISDCTAITDVSALGHVQHLTLHYTPPGYIGNTSTKVLHGLEALSHVDDLTIICVNMANIDLRYLEGVQKIRIDRCNNVNMPLETLRLLNDREKTPLDIRDCHFATQNEKDIQALELSSGLTKKEIYFYFTKNRASRRTEIVSDVATAINT
jgi:hypothetical protein